ncbi:RraA family protein [Oricola thermophila]|uniref:Putative 4-hydroxy-4-methyl-2-oxoglutarate aldolase n=1 Tax=Oricola thermophila TaxID=2742145 RepID=A0A6N1VKB3_9HYPH|nr:RraA family protein [Oricola thermophila]QKV20185.1 RraA family protein [Oricola thermophila]
MDNALFELLRSVNTPTVCDALANLHPNRAFTAYTQGTPLATAPDAPPLVGYACTGKIAGRTPSVEQPESVRERRLAYYRYMAAAPKPAIAVVEDLDGNEAVGAFWGEINATLHRAVGVSGVLTNGVVRDLGVLPDDFPIIAGSVGPSLAFAHVTGFGTPVKVFGLEVKPGDLVHADRHGAVVIPPDAVPALHEAITHLVGAERALVDAAREPGFDIAKLEHAWSKFEKTRR